MRQGVNIEFNGCIRIPLCGFSLDKSKIRQEIFVYIIETSNKRKNQLICENY